MWHIDPTGFLRREDYNGKEVFPPQLSSPSAYPDQTGGWHVPTHSLHILLLLYHPGQFDIFGSVVGFYNYFCELSSDSSDAPWNNNGRTDTPSKPGSLTKSLHKRHKPTLPSKPSNNLVSLKKKPKISTTIKKHEGNWRKKIQATFPCFVLEQ